jgi:hypothetical protein
VFSITSHPIYSQGKNPVPSRQKAEWTPEPVWKMMILTTIIIIIIIIHDKVCTHLHYSICKKLGTETAENWYSHIPKPVTEHEDVTVL